MLIIFLLFHIILATSILPTKSITVLMFESFYFRCQFSAEDDAPFASSSAARLSGAGCCTWQKESQTKKTGRKYPGGICETEKTCGFCRVLKFCSVDVLLHLPVRKHEDPYMETSSRFTGSHFIRTFEVCKLGTKRYCTWSLGSSKLLHIR